MKDILGTGLSGLVGSKFVEIYKEKYQCKNLDLTSGVDITNEKQVLEAVEASKSPVVIHMAAFTNADAAQQQKGDKTGVCYTVNVVGTQNIAKAAKTFGKHLIHISTAYVFDGEKETEYVEEDTPKPIEWYGETKALAEEVVQSECNSWTIFRIDQPFRQDPFSKPDIVHKMVAMLLGEHPYPLFTDHHFAPTIIEDFSRVLDWSIEKQPQGIYHATTGIKITDYELGKMIVSLHTLGVEVQQGSLDEYLKKAPRPYQKNTTLNSDKIKQDSDVPFTSLEEAVSHVQFSMPQ